METIRLAGVINDSIVDGPGLRYVIFTQGCPHHCEGCHNPESWDVNGGEEYSLDYIIEKFKNNPLLSGVTLSGGEPLCQPKECAIIAEEAKNSGLNVLLFTGYTYEQLKAMSTDKDDVNRLLSNIDILIDGKFEKSEKDLTLMYRGSRNQKIIDMNASREQDKEVLLEKYMEL